MIVFIVASVVLVAGLAVGVALGFLGGRSVHLAPATSSLGAVGLPDGAPTSDDVARVTFDRVLRGYRMDQVDAVLDRLQRRIAHLEAQASTFPLQPPARAAATHTTHLLVHGEPYEREPDGTDAHAVARPDAD